MDNTNEPPKRSREDSQKRVHVGLITPRDPKEWVVTETSGSFEEGPLPWIKVLMLMMIGMGLKCGEKTPGSCVSGEIPMWSRVFIQIFTL